jgi:hypothetical protein
VKFDNVADSTYDSRDKSIIPVPPVQTILRKPHRGSKQEPNTIYQLNVPLLPATAITIHKAQGMTADHVVILLGGMFARALFYVACSRVTSFKGLYLMATNKTPRLKLTDINGNPSHLRGLGVILDEYARLQGGPQTQSQHVLDTLLLNGFNPLGLFQGTPEFDQSQQECAPAPPDQGCTGEDPSDTDSDFDQDPASCDEDEYAPRVRDDTVQGRNTDSNASTSTQHLTGQSLFTATMVLLSSHLCCHLGVTY